MTSILAEVPVADADPEIRQIYDAIMSSTGVGSPALVYRHFAATPDLLPWIWQAIGEDLLAGTVLSSALSAIRKIPVTPLPEFSTLELRKYGLESSAHRTLDGILATYNRMNPVNLCLISAVRGLLTGEDFSPSDEPLLAGKAPPNATALPAPLGLDDVSADTRALILSLSEAIPSDSGRVIPTLYRHLAIWPPLLHALGSSLLETMESGEVEKTMDKVSFVLSPVIQNVGAAAATRIKTPPPVEDIDALVKTLDAFLYTIPQLIVVGYAIRAALPTADQ